MYTLIEIVQRSKQYVREGNGRPDFEVEEWIATCLHMKRFDLYLHHDRPMEEEELIHIKKGLPLLRKGEPLAYLLGQVFFWKDTFAIERGVLIPRPETESIVERSIHIIRTHGFSSMADVCTGSGCIGLSVKREIPPLNVLLLDLYEAPLQVARENARRLQREVDIRKGSLLEPLRENEAEFIIANPPYLSRKEWEHLDPSVRDFEPKEALVGGPHGTEFYEKLIEQALEKGVRAMVVEIGETQGALLSALFKQKGAISVEVFRDLFHRERGIEAHFSCNRVK